MRRTAGFSRTARWLVAGLLVLGSPPAHAVDGEADPEADPATAAIRFYQEYLSDLRHGHCPFTPSCSEYAAQAIARHGLMAGSARAADRLMRCNASARAAYPARADGLREDPVEGATTSGSVPRVPAWLLPPRASGAPVLPDTLEPGRRSRLEESLAFALRLEQRGDCDRAATEYQRVGSLAGTPAADAWAFARIGDCAFAATRWRDAERAYVTSGMLASDRADRAAALYRAAVCRFNAGAFAACERLLDDPLLEAAVAPEGPEPDVRPTVLRGLCALARGDWPRASAAFERAAPTTADSARVRRLAPFARQGADLPHRSPGLASTFSAVVPGSGQVYAGRARDGLRHFVVESALIWTVVALARDEHLPAAYLTAGLALPFYAGNVMGAGNAARRFDRDRRMDHLRGAIRESAR